MLVRLFVVLLLAFALVGVSGVPSLEAPPMVEVIDTDPPTEVTEVAVARRQVAHEPRTTAVSLILSSTEGVRASPHLERVFRPPRLLGS